MDYDFLIKPIKDFAQKHGLEFEVVECELPNGKFHVWFKDCKTLDGALLRGDTGHGENYEEAMADYARQIRYETIVFGAGTSNRRNIEICGFVAE